jgi:hypothetical protein
MRCFVAIRRSPPLGVAHVHCARVSVDLKRFTDCLGKTLSRSCERLAWRTRREHSPRRSDPSCRRSRVRDGSAASGAGSAVQPSATAWHWQPAIGDGICWCTPLIRNESGPKPDVRRGTTLKCRHPHAAHLGGSAAAYQCTHRALLRSKSELSARTHRPRHRRRAQPAGWGLPGVLAVMLCDAVCMH